MSYRAMWFCVAVALALIGVATPGASAAGGSSQCADLTTSTCGVQTTSKGDFHGLIMVSGQPSVLQTAAHSGTKPGCGDCSWELIVACLRNLPGTGAADQAGCTGAAGSPHCGKGQLLFRLFLTTNAVRNALVDLLCLGGTKDVIPVGDIAAADVQRYLKNVRPPMLDLKVDPPDGIPAGMPSYFSVRPPTTLRPAPFGGGQVTETITISPQRYRWLWGDGTATGWTDNAGAPYPEGTLTHTYVEAGRYAGTVTTVWGGTYTITVAGETYGPYDAVGTVSRTQPFSVSVLRAHSTLVSHG